MTTYSAIPGTDIDTDSPITESLMTKLRDNPIAISEGSTGAPKVLTAAINDLAVTTAKIADDNVTLAKMADDSVTFGAEIKTSTTTGSWVANISGQIVPRGVYAVYCLPATVVARFEVLVNSGWRIVQQVGAGSGSIQDILISDGVNVRVSSSSTPTSETFYYTKLFD